VHRPRKKGKRTSKKSGRKSNEIRKIEERKTQTTEREEQKRSYTAIEGAKKNKTTLSSCNPCHHHRTSSG